MEYSGKLYGKVGRKYIELEICSEGVDVAITKLKDIVWLIGPIPGRVSNMIYENANEALRLLGSKYDS